MHAVIRSYSGQGASELFDALAENEQEVQNIMSDVPGFVSYAAFRTDDGGRTVTVSQEKAGTDEATQRAAEWVRENVGVAVEPPTVDQGSTVLHF